jgi:hypothetical protein
VIALVATLLVAVYILGPDLFARWLLGFAVPRRNIVQTKSEEITRGVMWAIFPLILAWWLRRFGPFALAPNSKFDVQTFFSGIYSESVFKENRDAFFVAAGAFLKLNLCIIARLYGLVLLGSLFFNWLIGKYGTIRAWLVSKNKTRILRVFSTLILPRISEWHVILSPILLPSTDMFIAVDVLTKSGILYQGKLEDKVIAPDGGLQSVTLAEPKRFRREHYLKDSEAGAVSAVNYWKPIPGNLFVIVASDIATLNVRHIPASVTRFSREFKDIADALHNIAQRVKKLEH